MEPGLSSPIKGAAIRPSDRLHYKKERKENKKEILNDPSIDMILISSIPKNRSDNSIEALKAGKDVMVDKPGCTTLDQLSQIKQTVKETGKIWSVNFSERFHVAAVAKAEELVNNPKERYKLMTKSMPLGGELSLDMMYRTCGTQLNIDYESEDDFKKKFLVTNSIVPITIALFANSSIVEKKK